MEAPVGRGLIILKIVFIVVLYERCPLSSGSWKQSTVLVQEGGENSSREMSTYREVALYRQPGSESHRQETRCGGPSCCGMTLRSRGMRRV